MALNIKDPEAERLVSEIAALTGESKTGAVRQALTERKQRLLLAQGGMARVTAWSACSISGCGRSCPRMSATSRSARSSKRRFSATGRRGRDPRQLRPGDHRAGRTGT